MFVLDTIIFLSDYYCSKTISQVLEMFKNDVITESFLINSINKDVDFKPGKIPGAAQKNSMLRSLNFVLK